MNNLAQGAKQSCTCPGCRVRGVDLGEVATVFSRALTSREFLNRVVGGHYSIRSRVFFFISKNARPSQSQITTSCLLSKQTYHEDMNIFCEIITTLWYLNGI